MKRQRAMRDPLSGATVIGYVDLGPSTAVPGHGRELISNYSTSGSASVIQNVVAAGAKVASTPVHG